MGGLIPKVKMGSGQAKELKLNGMISKVDMIMAQYSRFWGQKEQSYRRTWHQSKEWNGY
jgi:hypothetical protein